MAFSGKYQQETQEGFKEFMKAIDKTKKASDIKITYEVEENGDDFKVTTTAGDKVVSNTFTIGQETMMELLQGNPVKTVVHREGQKLKAEVKNLTLVWELVDPNTLVITLSTPDNIASSNKWLEHRPQHLRNETYISCFSS